MPTWRRILQRVLGARRPEVNTGLESEHPVDKSLDANLDHIKQLFADSADLVCRRLQVGQRAAALVYLKGITNSQLIQQGIAQPLLNCQRSSSLEDILACLGVSDYANMEDLHQALQQMMDGRVLLICQGIPFAVAIDVVDFPKRNIDEAESDAVVSGPLDSFIESIEDNLALIRRRLRTPHFKSKIMRLGILSRTPVAICYLVDRVDRQLLEEVEQRLQRMQAREDLPKVLDSYYVMESISDHPLSPFPQVLQTERPDVIVAHLVEGRVSILVDGSPVALVVPAAFFDLLQTADDYYIHPLFASAARWLRLSALFITTSVSALYVAVTTFHYEVIPSKLVNTVAQTRGEVPLSSFSEAIILEITVDLLREATIRLPTKVGQVIGVVGALVVGQAAVQAGLVGPLLVIVVAIATIAGFAIPNNEQATALRMLRFPMILAANYLSGFGMIIVMVAVLTHLASMDSLGEPYMRPVAPLKLRQLKDVILRPFRKV